MLKRTFDVAVKSSPALKRALIGRLYDTVSGLDRNADVIFMNYGYAPLAPDEDTPALRPEDEANRYCIQLYHHVAGAVDLAGKKVLEVGSGRGGGASYVVRYLRPGALVGVDRCERAIRFCSGHHRVDGLAFRHGDAEAIPFPDDSFDAVINVESSHGYGSLPRFLGEVRRVLRHGGWFLYTDHRNRRELPPWRDRLHESGLTVHREEEITPQVVRALDLEDERKRALIDHKVPGWLRKSIHEFAATRGSGAYERFAAGETRYLNFVLQKNGASG